MRFDPGCVHNSPAKTFNFSLLQRIRLPIKSHQAHYSRNLQHSQTHTQRNPNKYVAWEERQFELHTPVLPTPHRGIERKKVFYSPCFKVLYYALLMTRAGVCRKPPLFAMTCGVSRYPSGNKSSCYCRG